MDVSNALCVFFIHIVFLFHLQECEIHEAFFSGDCSKASSFCKHKCINIDKGFICTCNQGYQLQRDGQSCQKIPDRSFSAKNSINSIPSGLPQNSLLQHSNSLHRTGNQIHYNIPNLQTDRHHVELGHSEKPLYPAKDNVELGSGGVLPPMSIMRPPTCDGVICQNGGHCVVQGFQTKCNCPLGFGDKFCQKVIPVKYPKFTGDGYLSFPEVTNIDQQFVIELEFRPDSSNGLMLFSADMKDAQSDFFSVAIVNGFVEFRFDCGTGEAILKSEEKVNPGDWNTVKVTKTDNKGSVTLNNQRTVTGYSKGAYSKLTLHLMLYLGGYIDLAAIATRVSVASSFSGCVKTMKVNNVQYDMRPTDNFGQADFGLNVGECSADECSGVVCQNGGRCTATSADHHICLCPLGWSGELCQKRIEVHVPGFGGHSFVRHQGLERSSLSLTEIEVVLKPTNWEGLILFNGYTNDRKGDYISLAMREGHLEFQFDLGTGPGVLRSVQALQLNAWHHVRVTRTGLQGIMEVDNQIRVEGNSEGGFTQLTLLQDLYIGGHDNFDYIPTVANLTSSFHGCLQKVVINGKQIDIVTSAKDGVNLDNCDHECVNQPCMNAGECEPDKGSYTCYCPLGFHGNHCEHAAEDTVTVPRFVGHSYLMYTNKQILDRINGNKVDIQLQIKPESADGLILWSSKDYPLSSHVDYMALGLRDSALILQYDLGSGSTEIIYNATNMFDGKWHSVKVQRDKQDGFIMVDNTQVVEGTSPGVYTVLNTNNVLYLGGMPDISHNSLKKFKGGFQGCLKDIILAEDYNIDLITQAKSGRNIESCSAS